MKNSFQFISPEAKNTWSSLRERSDESFGKDRRRNSGLRHV